MKRQKKIKNEKQSASGSFILIVGDEGAILVKISGGKVVRRIFAATPDESSTKNMADLLQQSPAYPVTLLFDFMDQSYVRQTLPPVSSFSVGKIITRRLNKDFSPDDIKGYVILDREKTGRKDWNYLMVSMPNNAILQKWINFAVERANPFRGIGLVPVEVQSMMKAIEKLFLKEKGKNAKPFEWNILVSHNKVGGFRQVVLRNGKLILTRMAQPVGESSPDVIAGNIEQEIINTLEYLKRLGLQDNALVSIIVICSEEIKKFLDTNNIKVGETHFLTPYEAANLLALKEAAQPNDHFGDIVISSFVAKRNKLLLQLNTKYTRKITGFYTYLKYIKYALIIFVVAFLGFCGFTFFDIFNNKQDINVLEDKGRKIANDVSSIKKLSSSSLQNDINYYSDVMGIIEMTQKPQYNFIAFIEKIAGLMQNAALVQKIEWTLLEPLKVQKDIDTRQIKSEIVFRLLNAKEGKSEYSQKVIAFINRTKKEFEGFNLTYIDIPGITSEEKEIKSVINDEGSVQDASTPEKNKDILTIAITGNGKQTNKNSGK